MFFSGKDEKYFATCTTRDSQGQQAFVYHSDYVQRPIDENAKKKTDSDYNFFELLLRDAKRKVTEHLDYYGSRIINGSVTACGGSVHPHSIARTMEGSTLWLLGQHEFYNCTDFRIPISSWRVSANLCKNPRMEYKNSVNTSTLELSYVHQVAPLTDDPTRTYFPTEISSYSYFEIMDRSKVQTLLQYTPISYQTESNFPMNGGPFTRFVTYLPTFVKCMDEASDYVVQVLETVEVFDIEIFKTDISDTRFENFHNYHPSSELSHVYRMSRNRFCHVIFDNLLQFSQCKEENGTMENVPRLYSRVHEETKDLLLVLYDKVRKTISR